MPGDPRPLLGRLLLRLLLRGEAREFVVGDIDEEFLEHVVPTLGIRDARRWYWSQVFNSIGNRTTRTRVAPQRHFQKGENLMATTWMDLRYAMRGLLKSPGFFFVAVLTLALGIGANTAIFSVVYTVLLQPLPFHEPDRLVEISETRPERGWESVSLSRPNFRDYREMNSGFVDIGAYMSYGQEMVLSSTGYPERISGAQVSAGFFKILGADPVLGRTFLPGEDEPGGDSRVVLLSNEFWRTRFAADSGIVGSSVMFDDNSYTVVGVLPPGRPWLDAAQAFVPMVRNPDADRGNFILGVIGRLAPGISVETARADLETIATQLAGQYPEMAGPVGIRLDPASNWIASDNVRRALWVMSGAVGFLLLIACVNLANLLMARATTRHRETAVRAALGAGRGRIVRQLLLESLLLGAIGAVVGLAIALATVTVLKNMDPGGIPRLAEVSLNIWVLSFSLGVGLLSGVVSGLLPAFQVPYSGLLTALREGDRSVSGGRGQMRLRAGLVSAEVALSLMLLVGAGLLIRSFSEILSVDRGFQTDNRMFFTVTLPPSYNENEGSRTNDFINLYLERASSIPQVQSAAAVSIRPLSGGSTGLGILAEGQEAGGDESVPWASWRLISGDYFQTLGLPILRGRTFTELDQIADPWRAVISKRVADLLWPGEDPVGRQAILWAGQGNNSAEIIGVVGDMRERGLDSEPTLAVYLPIYGAGWTSVNFVLHTAGDPMPLVSSLRGMLADLDPNLPISEIERLDEMVDDSVSTRRFNMFLLLVFAALALVLALAGIYGVQSYTVAQRTSEIGIRVALGAPATTVIKQIVRQGMLPALVGIVLGAGGAFGLSRFMSTLLFGIQPTDPATYVGFGILLALAALASCFVPARRATRVDPVAALREE